jgi:hypothetical protein
MQKNKKCLGGGMEIHNSTGRGSWTHVQIRAKYVQQTNKKNMKFKGLTLSMIDVKVLLQTKLLEFPPKL